MTTSFNEEQNEHLQTVSRDVRENQREVLQVVAEKFGVNGINFEKSIASIYKNNLLISIVYGYNDSHTCMVLPVDESEASDIIDRAQILISDNLRDSVERLRRLTPKNPN